jgi:hypothetical protein
MVFFLQKDRIMIKIKAVQLIGGEGHEHISTLCWINEATGESGVATRQQMVTFVGRNPACTVYTRDGHNNKACVVVRDNGRIKYVQTLADNVYTNNLLALPRF